MKRKKIASISITLENKLKEEERNTILNKKYNAERDTSGAYTFEAVGDIDYIIEFLNIDEKHFKGELNETQAEELIQMLGRIESLESIMLTKKKLVKEANSQIEIDYLINSIILDTEYREMLKARYFRLR